MTSNRLIKCAALGTLTALAAAITWTYIIDFRRPYHPTYNPRPRRD